jgi:hypothetical protein
MDVNLSIIFIVRDRASVTKILNVSHNDNKAWAKLGTGCKDTLAICNSAFMALVI